MIKATSKLFSAKSKDKTLFKPIRDKGRNLESSQITESKEGGEDTSRQLRRSGSLKHVADSS